MPVLAKELNCFDGKDANFSLWIHFERSWQKSDEEIIANIIRSGCRYIMISGVDADVLHDTVDEIAISITPDLVLTAANKELSKDTAFEFLTTSCPGCSNELKIYTVLTKDDWGVEDQLRTMSDALVEADR